MKSLRTAAIVLILVLLASPSYCRTWYVTVDGTGDAPTIRAAIDNAQAGDDVLVAPGTYTWTNQGGGGPEGMIHMKSGIWLHSEGGPEVTILDAERQERVIHCSAVNNQATIEGLTLTQGRSLWAGGGILCEDNSSPRIIDSVILQCEAAAIHLGMGGGITCIEGSSPEIANNLITVCVAYSGGAIYCGSSAQPTIRGNNIIDNWTVPPELDWQTYGGGIHCESSSPEINENVIAENRASIGGGINVDYNSTVYIENNLIRDNLGYNNGAAVHCSAGITYIYHNTIVANEAPGGVWYDGGAIGCEYSSDIHVWCNIIEGTVYGAALSCVYGCEIDALSNDFWNNDNGDGTCDVSAGGNIHEDPLFCNPDSDDYTLSENSPCLNAPGMPCLGRIGAFPEGCGTTGTEQMSWGRLKALYQD